MPIALVLEKEGELSLREIDLDLTGLLDHPPFAVEQFQFDEPGIGSEHVDAFGGALPAFLLVDQRQVMQRIEDHVFLLVAAGTKSSSWRN